VIRPGVEQILGTGWLSCLGLSGDRKLRLRRFRRFRLAVQTLEQMIQPQGLLQKPAPTAPLLCHAGVSLVRHWRSASRVLSQRRFGRSRNGK
jgi:hypothetical protein